MDETRAGYPVARLRMTGVVSPGHLRRDNTIAKGDPWRPVQFGDVLRVPNALRRPASGLMYELLRALLLHGSLSHRVARAVLRRMKGGKAKGGRAAGCMRSVPAPHP